MFSLKANLISKPYLFPLTLALVYLCSGSIWILFSDTLASRLFVNPEVLKQVSITKGFFFLLATAYLLYLLISGFYRELMRSRDIFYGAFITSPDSININRLDDGVFLQVNEGFTVSTGYTMADILGKSSDELNIWVDHEDRKRLAAAIQKKNEIRDFKSRFRRKDGSIAYGIMSARLIKFDGNQCIISITRDVTKQIKAEAELEKLSFYDPLTGLANHRLLDDRLTQLVALANREHRTFTVFFVGLHRFDIIMEAFGHRGGEEILKTVSKRFKNVLRETDIVARLRGDEFVIVSPSPPRNLDIPVFGSKILSLVSEVISCDNLDVMLSGTIGIACFPIAGT